jgi:tRNA-2-methylthio-N6-dimethylallyladenosine synthase
LRFLNSVVTEVSHRRNKRYLDKTVEVLVEGRSDRSANRLSGRTRTNKIVNFEGSDGLIGELVDVHIQSANPWALRGAIPLSISTKS